MVVIMFCRRPFDWFDKAHHKFAQGGRRGGIWAGRTDGVIDEEFNFISVWRDEDFVCLV